MPDYGTLAAALTDKLAQFTKGFSDKLVPAATVLERTEEGQLTKSLFEHRYMPILHQGLEHQAKQAHDGIKSGAITGHVDVGSMVGQAQKIARTATAGPKDANFVALAKSVHDKHGQLAAESYTNAVSYMLKDYNNPAETYKRMLSDPTTTKKEINSFLNTHKGMAPYSPFKESVYKAGVPLKNTSPEYTPTGHGLLGRAEGPILSVLNATFAPAIVIPHASTILNGLLGTTPDKFLHGAAQAMHFSMGQAIDKHEALMTTGAFAEHHLNAIRDWNLFKASGVPSWRANTPAFWLYKALHQPGFRPLRDYTLLSGVNAAQMTITDLADKFAKNPKDSAMMFSLHKWGINPQDVVKQGGKLDQGQLERAIYSYVDNAYFLDNHMYRSPLFNGTSVGRILGMYHSYVTRQAKLMSRSFTDSYRKGQGLGQTLRNVAVMTTLFPVVGEIIKLSQMSVRGQNAGDQVQQDLENITGQGDNGIYDSAGTYMEALGHMGSFGIYNHLLRGGYTHSIINEAAGPVGSAVGNLAQDSTNLVKHRMNDDYEDLSGAMEAAKPVGRDLSYDIPGVSSLAYILNHRFIPKDIENPDDDPAKQLYDWFQDTGEELKPQTETKKEKAHGRTKRSNVIR